MFFKKILWSFQGSLFRFPVSRPDDVVFRPDAHQSATSVWTTWRSVQKLISQQHPSGRRVIPSGRSSVHSSQTVRTTCHIVRTPDRPSIICPDKVGFRPDPPLYREASVLTCIYLDDSTAHPDDFQWSISFRFCFQVLIREDWFNRLDDVDSRPDALIYKAGIAIQIQPSGRQSAWFGRAFNRYGNCVFNFNRSDACLSWSGCALNRYGNCILKINGPDGHPPWSGCAKPYMEITCSGRATVRTRLSNRKDFQRKSHNFCFIVFPSRRPMTTVRTSSIFIKAIAHLNP